MGLQEQSVSALQREPRKSFLTTFFLVKILLQSCLPTFVGTSKSSLILAPFEMVTEITANTSLYV